MSVQTNFRAEDMLGAPKAAVVATPVVEAKKVAAPANKKAAKPVEPVVEAVVEPVAEVPAVEETVVEEAPAETAE
jgi:hypothetical protein